MMLILQALSNLNFHRLVKFIHIAQNVSDNINGKGVNERSSVLINIFKH